MFGKAESDNVGTQLFIDSSHNLSTALALSCTRLTIPLVVTMTERN